MSYRNYLRRCRVYEFESGCAAAAPEGYNVKPADIITFAWQISRGMAYLAELKVPNIRNSR